MCNCFQLNDTKPINEYFKSYRRLHKATKRIQNNRNLNLVTMSTQTDCVA